MGRSVRGLCVLTAVLLAIVGAVYFLPSAAEQEAPTVVHVGVLPSQQADLVHQRYSALLDHLSRQTGWEFKLVVASSYEHLLDLFGERKVDLAHFGGFTFVKAQATSAARPLVMRDIDSRVTTLFVVKSDSPLRACANLSCPEIKGKKLLFGPPLSTSGHLMPRHLLVTEKAIEPEQFFAAVEYSAGHRDTARQVRDGKADIGAINAGVLRAMLREGELSEDALHVIWETPPFPDNAWTVQADMDEQVQTKLRNAFLILDLANEGHRQILASVGASSFVPAGDVDFIRVGETARALGLLNAGP